MAEYNKLYIDCKNRLSILKYHLNENEELYNRIDSLLKELDDRYSENLQLYDIENEITSLEGEIK